MSGSRWTEAERAVLLREWHEVGQRTLRAKLPGRSWVAIRDKARVLGLPAGVPQGHASVASLARRLGYTHVTLRRLLAEHGVALKTLYRSGSRRGRPGRACPRRYVELDAAEAACAARAATETIHGAARVRGVDEAALYKRLRASGALEVREGHRPGSAHRLPSAVIDAALIGYRHRKRAACAPRSLP